eukprot:13264500-Alexandrium_andersonii.AAC.1
MKTSRRMDHSGKPCLRARAHGAWAEYISRSAAREWGNLCFAGGVGRAGVACNGSVSWLMLAR